MTETETNLLQALLDLETAAQQMATASPKPDLRALLARIEALAQQLPRDADRDLLHYLQRRSYEKARFHLQGRAAEKGACGH